MSTVSTKDSAGTEPYTIDDILRDRALTDTPPSFLAYPKKKDTSGGYEVLSTLDVDRLVDGAAETLTEHGFPPVVRHHFCFAKASYGLIGSSIARRDNRVDYWST